MRARQRISGAPGFVRAVCRLAALVSLAALAAGCGGGSPGSHVAQLGSTTSTTQSSTSSDGSSTTPASGGSTNSVSATLQTLAYARCMRSHGVPTFPDPTSAGLPKAQVVAARKANPSRFDSAESACSHLLPSGGGNGETPAEIAQDWNQDRRFAQCMRHDGIPNWPDPTDRSTTDSRPVFRITAVGLDGNSPQLRAKAQHCASSLHMIGLPAAG